VKWLACAVLTAAANQGAGQGGPASGQWPKPGLQLDGTFTSARRPHQQIEVPIDGWNERWRPFTWTKTADDLLPHC